MTEPMKNLPQAIATTLMAIVSQCEEVVVGKKEDVEALLVALLSEGHVLLEGVPGVAKTTIAKTFAHVIGLDFHRIQGTADTMPADIIGTMVFDPTKNSFRIQKGPVFTNILLVDEINRNSPRTNSAVLEAMQERQVTISGETLELPKPFMTIATQSPIEFHGVFPLPEVLVDRFLLSLNVDYPTSSEEIEMTNRIYTAPDKERHTITRGQLAELIETTKRVYMAPNVQSYIVDLVQRSRHLTGVSLGGSPRASIALSKASRALALLSNRTYVTPDDVKQLAPLVLRHRLIPSATVGSASGDDLAKALLDATPIPEREK